MYNSFLVKKRSQQQQREILTKSRLKLWQKNYKSRVRPTLLQKYSRRINNFVVRLEQDKTQLYQYRQNTQAKAHELLKQIQRKQAYIGQPTIKLRDNKDWNSILSTTQRIQKQKNKKIFQNKFGDSNLAYRSIASQSQYNPSLGQQFRLRRKQSQIHPHNMRFTCKSQSFYQKKKQRKVLKTQINKTTQQKQYTVKRANSTQSHPEQQIRSRAHSVFSFSNGAQYLRDQAEQQTNKSKQGGKSKQKQKQNKSSGKVYFKQVVDLSQCTEEPSIKKSLHNILVRFGISKIKDVKKQAMLQTDKLQSDDF